MKLKTNIENFLIEGDKWKLFISEQGSDFENASLTSLYVSIEKIKKTSCEFQVDIMYLVLEDANNSIENGVAKFSTKNEIRKIVKS